MNKSTDDTFLARWLNNELSSEELEQFKSSPEYAQYQKIIAATDSMQSPEFDTIGTLSSIKTRSRKKSPKASTQRYWAYGIAASLAAIISFVFFFQGSKTVESNFGEQLAYVLPDNSEVILNAKSQIRYNERKWDDNRSLELQGEAFFKVEKGSAFEVNTALGKVTVLGTQFNVIVDEGLFQVQCFEGKVRVDHNDNEFILTQGKALRAINDQQTEQWQFNSEQPNWLSKESSFNSLPIRFVINALEKQFDIKVVKNELDENILFTGSFPHSDLELALKTVFGTLNISYSIKDNHTVILE